MNSQELRNNFELLLVADPDRVDRDALADLVASASRLRGWLDSVDLRYARQARRLAEAGKSEPAESMFSRSGRRSSRGAGLVTDREAVADTLSGFETALGDGQVSAGHLDAIAAAVRPLDEDTRVEFNHREDELLTHAATESVDAFQRRCRTLARQLRTAGAGSDSDELDVQRRSVSVKRWVDKITGMCHTHLELDPLRDAALWSVINDKIVSLRQTDGNSELSWNQLQADAVVAAASDGIEAGQRPSGVGSGSGSERRVPEITVLIDWASLIDGLHVNGVCETGDGIPLPVSAVRRLCCDAEVLPVVLGGNGEALDVGRSSRTANRHQRRALKAMHATCGHRDCTVSFDACRIHHIKWWWEHNGPTDIDNLIPLCEKHHHLVHEGRWTLTMTPGRVATWTRPDGTVAFTELTTDRAPNGVRPPPGHRKQTRAA